MGNCAQFWALLWRSQLSYCPTALFSSVLYSYNVSSNSYLLVVQLGTILNSKGLSCLLSEMGVTVFSLIRDRGFYAPLSDSSLALYTVLPRHRQSPLFLFYKNCPHFGTLIDAAVDKSVSMKRIYLLWVIWIFREHLWEKCWEVWDPFWNPVWTVSYSTWVSSPLLKWAHSSFQLIFSRFRFAVIRVLRISQGFPHWMISGGKEIRRWTACLRKPQNLKSKWRFPCFPIPADSLCLLPCVR